MVFGSVICYCVVRDVKCGNFYSTVNFSKDRVGWGVDDEVIDEDTPFLCLSARLAH